MDYNDEIYAEMICNKRQEGKKCKYDGKDTDWNFMLEKFMHGSCLYKGSSGCIIPGSNENNVFDKVKQKFSKLVPADDIFEISKISDEKRKRIKAVDILFHPKFYCKKDNNNNCIKENGNIVACNPAKESCGSPVSGHLAMIIAIDRDTNGNPKEIYVGEASGTGNKVTKFESWDAFAKGKDVRGNTSSWSKTYLYPSYIINMDHVYDYFSRINNLKDENGNPLDGNTYKYTDMWK